MRKGPKADIAVVDIFQRALSAKRESKYIEFKSTFDPSSAGEWCELIKDIVSIANSGGGIILFGVDSEGSPTGDSIKEISDIDPAEIGNKIAKYTGPVDVEFTIHELNKQSHSLIAFVVRSVSVPVVFQKPGTYDIGEGKQKTAFSKGTVYFRHGAKSEPGTSEDIRQSIERHLDLVRKSWLKGVRKVVEAPSDTQFVAVRALAKPLAGNVFDSVVRVVNDPNATPVRLTRDRSQATGSFVHEEVSEAIFDEINNVIDANRVLGKGQQRFLLGQPIYYRVYAERQHVTQTETNVALLFHSGAIQFYAPSLFWLQALPKEHVAEIFLEIYLNPVSPNIHFLIKSAIILGEEFSDWLFNKWHLKWANHPQPPSFYWRFKEMIGRAKTEDMRLVATKTSPTSLIIVGDESVTVSTLMDKPERAAALLSRACMRVFEGAKAEMRSIARQLDFISYGAAVRERGSELTEAIIRTVGDQVAGAANEVDDKTP
ncbi:MAG: ATP-binding protein [Proteobacteria bacterium]|nr:ATP-binding protein [Pseudomonadota bacterium]